MAIFIKYGSSSLSTVFAGLRIPNATISCPCCPLYRPSIAASFMGWRSATVTAEVSPEMEVSTMPIKPTHAPTFRLRKQWSALRLRSSIHPETPTTNTPARVHALSTVCSTLLNAIGEVATVQKLVISLRMVSGLKVQPTGSCIQAFATRIQ